MIPRIQGKVGQATEPPEFKDKWFFEMWLTSLGAGESGRTFLGQFGPWDTEAQAKTELKIAARVASEAIENEIAGKVSGKYIDMNTNETRSWDEH